MDYGNMNQNSKQLTFNLFNKGETFQLPSGQVTTSVTYETRERLPGRLGIIWLQIISIDQ